MNKSLADQLRAAQLFVNGRGELSANLNTSRSKVAVQLRAEREYQEELSQLRTMLGHYTARLKRGGLSALNSTDLAAMRSLQRSIGILRDRKVA